MAAEAFRAYTGADRDQAMALLDANIPEAFHPGERGAFTEFLSAFATDYRVLPRQGRLIAAFALSAEPQPHTGRIRWLMAHPEVHGIGLGRAMMDEVKSEARARGIALITIAASHVSEAFYTRFGATVDVRTHDGWGPGMHRVDMTWRI
ncbi:MAG: GNAT family N-acetyltransferase [Pseudomonadota bacterium]